MSPLLVLLAFVGHIEAPVLRLFHKQLTVPCRKFKRERFKDSWFFIILPEKLHKPLKEKYTFINNLSTFIMFKNANDWLGPSVSNLKVLRGTHPTNKNTFQPHNPRLTLMKCVLPAQKSLQDKT